MKYLFLISYLGRQTDSRSNRTANAIKHNKQASTNFKNTARVTRLYTFLLQYCYCIRSNWHILVYSNKSEMAWQKSFSQTNPSCQKWNLKVNPANTRKRGKVISIRKFLSPPRTQPWLVLRSRVHDPLVLPCNLN